MTRTNDLSRLRQAAMSHLARLRHDAAGIPATPPVRPMEIVVCYITVHLLNLWTNFSRAYYLSCMLGAKRETGGRVSVAHPGLSYNDAIGRAVHQWRPHALPKADGSWDRRSEPTWHEPNTLLTPAAAQAFSNLADVQNALSTGVRVFIDLPVFRNYFAHRNKETSGAAVAIAPLHGMPPTKRPSNVVLSHPLGRPQSLLLEWMDEIDISCEFLCY